MTNYCKNPSHDRYGYPNCLECRPPKVTRPRRTLRTLMDAPPSPKAVDALVNPTQGPHIVFDEYMLDMVRGLQPGKSICLPTPWGYYGLKLDADGGLEIYMATITGGTRNMHVVPRSSNVIEIKPGEL